MSSPAAYRPGPSAVPGLDRRRSAFVFENTYARLPERFYARVNPTPVAAPRLIHWNEQLARRLGVDSVAPTGSPGSELVEILAGNRVAEGSEPLAMAYAGHQFGHFVPQLGDGRANLLGEVVGRDGVRYDIQLKGSGPTPFSRRGDGRAALGPVLREYLVSEAMAALGVPTTRALAAVTTGERVLRETVTPGAVLTRVAASHLRVGTFQYFAARSDTGGIRTLADFAIARHFPEAAESPQPYRALLEGVVARQARLVAQWMLFGFVHGVMNTDNTSISGETIDYGPCAFLETYRPDTVFSSIDHQGRYSYSNQPHAALWNLTRLAETLLPILNQGPARGVPSDTAASGAAPSDAAISSAKEALSTFHPQFAAALSVGWQRKIGLLTEREHDTELAQSLLDCMSANHADFTLTMRRLCDAAAAPEGDAGVRVLFNDPAAYDAWAARWRRRLQEEPASALDRARAMRLVNPLFLPRNHRVEAALQAAVHHADFAPFEELLKVVSRPFEEQPGFLHYATPAAPGELVHHTFCGT